MVKLRKLLQTRVSGVKETMYHDPYYQRYIVGTPRVVSMARGIYGERITPEASNSRAWPQAKAWPTSTTCWRAAKRCTPLPDEKVNMDGGPSRQCPHH